MNWSVFPLIVLALGLPVAFAADPAPVQPSAEKPKDAEPADNSYCLVCHRNFEKESLNVTHTKIGTGCEKCHGLSEKHSSDEDGITPPEIMYSRAKINAACVKCHKVEILANQELHKPLLAALAAQKADSKKADVKKKEDAPKDSKKDGVKDASAAKKGDVCTDCHGEHQLKNRTRHWDKDTGKLIADDGVRMMDKGRAATGMKPEK